MHSRLKFVLVSIAIGMIPAAMVIYEFFFRPASYEGKVMIPPRLWYTLCALTPGLLPLLSWFEKHHWPGGFVFGVLLVLSNIVIYGLCGALISLMMKRATHRDRAASPDA